MMPIAHPNMLAQAEALYWVVRLGGFHAASRHLNLSQPTISARIRELEMTLGEQLFHRGAKQAKVTAAGERAYSYAEGLLNLTSALRYRDNPYGGLHGILHIGAVETVAHAFLPLLISQVQRELPEIEHSVTVDMSCNLAQMLRRQTLDVAIVSDIDPAPMLESVLLGQINVQWICRSDLMKSSVPLTAERLKEMPILTHPRGSRLFTAMHEWFTTQNVRPQVIICNSMLLMSRFVAQGFGTALLPTCMVRDELRSGELSALIVDPPIQPAPIFLCFNKNRDGSALRSVMTILETEARKSILFDDC
jgi:DNA-binding transcriptional LysR family regulator